MLTNRSRYSTDMSYIYRHNKCDIIILSLVSYSLFIVIYIIYDYVVQLYICYGGWYKRLLTSQLKDEYLAQIGVSLPNITWRRKKETTPMRRTDKPHMNSRDAQKMLNEIE